MESIIQKEKECFFCRRQVGLHSHHIFGGIANRPKSEKLGLKVWLCYIHHTGSPNSVHMDPKGPLNKFLHEVGQRAYEANVGSREEFMRQFGRNYL